MAYPKRTQRKYMQLRAQGDTPNAAAVTLGIPPPTVYRWEDRADIRQNIEKLAQEYISLLPDANKLTKDVIEAANSVPKTLQNIKLIELGCKEADGIRKSVGITPSHASSVVIGNLVIGSQTVIDPRVAGLLGGQMAAMADAIDVTPNIPVLSENVDSEENQ